MTPNNNEETDHTELDSWATLRAYLIKVMHLADERHAKAADILTSSVIELAKRHK